MIPFTKLPAQTIVGVGIDFAARLAPTETIASFTVDDAGAGIVADSWVDGTKILATLTGGTAGQKYVVTYTATGSLGTVEPAQIEVSILPAANTCTIVADLKSLGLQPVAGVVLTVRSKYVKGIGGAVIDAAAQTDTTDVNGHAEVVVAQGLSVEIDFPPVKQRLTVDTTSKATVNIADLLV